MVKAHKPDARFRCRRSCWLRCILPGSRCVSVSRGNSIDGVNPRQAGESATAAYSGFFQQRSTHDTVSSQKCAGSTRTIHKSCGVIPPDAALLQLADQFDSVLKRARGTGAVSLGRKISRGRRKTSKRRRLPGDACPFETTYLLHVSFQRTRLFVDERPRNDAALFHGFAHAKSQFSGTIAVIGESGTFSGLRGPEG